MPFGEHSVIPMYIDFAGPAQAEVSGAIEYIRAEGGDADQFADRVARVFRGAAARLAEEVAANTGKPFDQTDGPASIRWAQPVYRLRVDTATKRKRGSAAGVWYT